MEDPAGGIRDAESLFRSKPISEIRNVEASTKKEIEEKKEELRQLVGKSYRDLIQSADSILLMKSSCQSISTNISKIEDGINFLSSSAAAIETPKLNPNPARISVYGIASRVKYLVDTPENIWGCLDESMFLEASGRYLRAKVVHGLVVNTNADTDFLSNFPLLSHQWQIVESFKAQISQRSRERLMDHGLTVSAYADALASIATVDDLDPKQALALFLDSRRSWISQKLGMSSLLDSTSVSSVFCDVVRIIQISLAQVGELFLQVLSDMPMFYKTVLGSPPGSQLFGGIPYPEEEVRLWKTHRENLESVMVTLEHEFVTQACSSWLNKCGEEIVGKTNDGRYLIDVIGSGEELSLAEKLIRETLNSREMLEGSLEWLRSVFGSEIESPWNRMRELVLKVDDKDLWDAIFEDAFVQRMKDIVNSGFKELSEAVNVRDSVQAIVADPRERNDFQAYLKKPSTGGGVWFLELNSRKAGLGSSFKVASADEKDFHNCLNAYFGPEVSQIRDAVDSKCQSILEDLLCFLDTQRSTFRLKELAPYLQDKCFNSISTILKGLEAELEQLLSDLGKGENGSQPPAIIVERSLLIGCLLFAFRNYSSHIPLILGSPRQWMNETSNMAFSNVMSMSRHSLPGSPRWKTLDSPRRQTLDSPRRQSSSGTAALFGVDDSASPKLDELSKTLRDLCIKAHSLWISWVSDELSLILAKNLEKDDSLSATTSLRGWEETVIKQEQSNEGPLEMKITLPSMPSLYITSFLFQACQEIHRVGGHVLDKFILHNFAWRLLEKVVGIYGDFLTLKASTPQMSDKGVLQVLLDLRFTVDVLSGGKDSSFNSSEWNAKEESSKNLMLKLPNRRKQTQFYPNSACKERVMGLTNNLSQRLDPIDWATYEPYLWENEKQSYQRYAVLFGFLVQLNRMYTDTIQKLPINAESNILRCSTVPRFKYLPISAPALSSRGASTSALSTSSDDISSRSSWKAYSNGDLSPKLEFDDTSSFGAATPLLKSFMTQVGSKFGESTLKLGSMLTDAQVGRLKDKSAAAMSTFGDMLPAQAAGLLSSLTAARSDY